MNVNKFSYGDKDNAAGGYRSLCCTNLLSDSFTESLVYIYPNLNSIESAKSYIYFYKEDLDKMKEDDVTSRFKYILPSVSG